MKIIINFTDDNNNDRSVEMVISTTDHDELLDVYFMRQSLTIEKKELIGLLKALTP